MGDFSFQLRIKGVDLSAEALPQIFGAHFAVVTGQSRSQRRLGFDVWRDAQTQRRDQFGLRDFHRFLFLFDGDAGETRHGAGGKIRSDAPLSGKLIRVIVAYSKELINYGDNLVLLGLGWNWNSQIFDAANPQMLDGHANSNFDHSGLETWALNYAKKKAITEQLGKETDQH